MMIKKENEMVFTPEGQVKFFIETVEGEQEVVKISFFAGYELKDILELYFKKDFKTLFKDESEPVSFAEWRGITYLNKTDDVQFEMNIPTGDIALVKLSFSKDKLNDENAKKIQQIRDIIDFDPESE